ncbi:MAG: glycosyltransferase [Gammaproteobacteria bacterium]|nr:glycosyltransferase [Gammaproteobacteria bacterium]
MRALVYVQHLLGIGHLVRAGALARGLEAAGVRVTLVSGGSVVPGADRGVSRFVQLPPVRAADRSFAVLLDEHDRPIDGDWRSARRERLLALLDAEQPDLLLIEMYPFGRRKLRFEIEPLLERAAARREASGRPVIASSVRDVLIEPSSAQRVDEMVERVRRYFDLVLIHADPALIPFERSFARFPDIAHLARYTGYVLGDPPPAADGGPGSGEVLVSVGGGTASDGIVEAVMEARALTSLAAVPWRVLVGHGCAEQRLRTLRDAAPRGVVVERARTDFLHLLANSRLSISRGGYNTVVEVLAAGVPALCLPFVEERASEQWLRCRLLAERGVIETVAPDEIDAGSIAAAVARALEAAPARTTAIDTRGAGRSAELLLRALEARGLSGGRAAS